MIHYYNYSRLWTQKTIFFVLYLLCASGQLHSYKICDFNSIAISGIVLFTTHVSFTNEAAISTAKKKNSSSISGVIVRQPTTRDARILKDLSKLNKKGCLAKILCGLEVAAPPSDKTSTINDYAYVVRSFFDTFSIQGIRDSLQDDVEPKKSPKPIRSRGGTKTKKKPGGHYEYNESMDSIAYKDRMKADTSSLEDLLDEDEFLFGFRRRQSSSINKTIKQNFVSRNSRPIKSTFLGRKQREYLLATNESQKVEITNEVGKRLRSPRQCRAMQLPRGFSFCPFQVSDMREFLFNSTRTTTTTVKPPAKVPIKPIKDFSQLYADIANNYNFQDNEFPNAFGAPESVVFENTAYEGFVAPDDAYTAKMNYETENPKSMGRHRYTVVKRRTTTTERPNIIYFSPESRKTHSISEEDTDNEEQTASNESDEKSGDDTSNNKDASDEKSQLEHDIQNSGEESEEENDEENKSQQKSNEKDENNTEESQDDENGNDDDENDEEDDSDDNGNKKIKGKVQNVKESSDKYSIMGAALNFNPIKVEKDYGLVAQSFARPSDSVINYDKFLGGLYNTWDPNDGEWKETASKEDPTYTFKGKEVDSPKKSEDTDESSEEQNEDEKEVDSEEEEDDVLEQESEKGAPIKKSPPLPQVRYPISMLRPHLVKKM